MMVLVLNVLFLHPKLALNPQLIVEVTTDGPLV